MLRTYIVINEGLFGALQAFAKKFENHCEGSFEEFWLGESNMIAQRIRIGI